MRKLKRIVDGIEEEYFDTITDEEFLIIEVNNIKNSYTARIKNSREANTSASINGFQVATLEDRENIQGAITHFDTLSQGSTTIKWTMEDNTESDVTLQDLQDVIDLYVLRKGQVFAEYQVKKSQIEACTTIEELEALGL